MAGFLFASMMLNLVARSSPSSSGCRTITRRWREWAAAFAIWAWLQLWHWQQAFALQLLALRFAGTANGFGLFANTLFRWLFESLFHTEFTKQALTLHLLLHETERLLHIVVTDENAHLGLSVKKSK
jgi:hypothetical protein